MSLPAQPSINGTGEDFYGGTAIFLTSYNEIWLHLVIWATSTIALIFLIAGCWGARVSKSKHAVR